MILNAVTTKQDLDELERKIESIKTSIESGKDDSYHTIDAVIKEFQYLTEGDKHHTHSVKIKKMASDIKELDLKVEATVHKNAPLEMNLSDLINIFYNRKRVLDRIEYLADKEIHKHIDFLVGEVVNGHTVDPNVFDSINQYTDLRSISLDELNSIVFDIYIQKVADEALEHNYMNPTFDFLKSTILSKIQELKRIHFPSENERMYFDDHLSKMTDRQWDNIIKTALL